MVLNIELPRRIDGPPPAVLTTGLRKTFQGRKAMDDVNLTVPAGAVYLLVGENGAGKTTTMKTLLDLVKPDAGTATVLGLDSRKDGAKVRAHVGYVPETRGTAYGWLPVGRLLEHHASYYPSWDKAYATELIKRLDVALDRRFRTLSKGESRRVQLVTALAHRPPVLLLDEPTDGLDPLAMERLLQVIREHRDATGATMILSTHLVQVVEGLADHLGVMAKGKIACQVARKEIESRLKRYSAVIPAGWGGATAMPGTILLQRQAGPGIEWWIWGDEAGVVERLNWSGAQVSGVTPLTLQEAAVTLLAHEEATR